MGASGISRLSLYRAAAAAAEELYKRDYRIDFLTFELIIFIEMLCQIPRARALCATKRARKMLIFNCNFIYSHLFYFF